MDDDAAAPGLVAGPTTVLGVTVPAHVEVGIAVTLEAAFADACFYPPDTALASVGAAGCPVRFVVAVAGERAAVLDPDTGAAQVLSRPEDFRARFRDGDEDVRDATLSGALEWACPSWATVFEDVSALAPGRPAHETCRPLSMITPDVVSALRLAVSEASAWVGWLDLFAPGCPPARWVEAVLTGRPGMRALLLEMPGCPQEAQVAAALSRG